MIDYYCSCDKHKCKGDSIRPYNRERYEKNFNLIFGEECDVCKGEGYLEDKDAKGKIIKTMCLVCGGSGKAKGE